MKRSTLIAIGLIIVVLVAIVGVVGYYAFFNAPKTSPETGFKVAVVLDGAAMDGSWNQMWYDGLNVIKLSHPEIQTSWAEWVYPADYERIATGYATQGYDLIIGTTPEYQDGALRIAPQFPNLAQVTQGGYLNTTKFAPLNIWTNEGSYLVGMLAAYMTNTSVIGVVGTAPYPSQIAAHDGFMAGARSVNPNIQIKETFTQSWTDTALGRSAAIAEMDAGADVLYFTSSGMASGGIPAVAEENHVAIGAFTDLNGLAPKNVITSVLWNPPSAMMAVINDVKAGTFDGTTKGYDYSMKDGAVVLAPYHYFDDLIPSSVKNKIADTTQAIMNGTLVVPRDTSR